MGSPESTETPAMHQDNPSKHEQVKGLTLALCVASVTVISFLLMLDMSVLSTAIPPITATFHSLSDIGWYTGAYQLGCAVLQPLTGKLYSLLRTKHVFLAHLFVFELGSLMCALATSSQMLIAGRAIAGLGASGLMNGGLQILTNSTPLEKRPLYTGVMLGIAQMGLATGPLIGGVLTQHVSWRWCFWINLPMGAVAALSIVLVRIPDAVAKEAYSLALLRRILPQLDLVGFSLFAPSIVMFLLALQFGGEGSHPWNSATVIGLLCGGLITFGIFSFWESRVGEKAMIPGAMLRIRIMVASSGLTFCLMAVILVGSTFLPVYFQAVKGVTPIMSGVSVLPGILSQLLFLIIAGAAVAKLGYYLPWAVGGSAAAAIGNGLLSTLSPTTKTATWIGFQIVLGAGRGCALQMSMVASQSALPPSLIPVSLAFLVFVQNISASITVIIANTIFTQSLLSKLVRYAPSISPQKALSAGGSAEAVRNLLPPGKEGELEGVLQAYSESLANVWYLLAGFSVLALVFACGTGWVDVRKKGKDKTTTATASVSEVDNEKADDRKADV